MKSTGGEVPMSPAPSMAVAVTVCGPSASVSVFQETRYGGVVIGSPTARPST